jgi:hypothetical protein
MEKDLKVIFGYKKETFQHQKLEIEIYKIFKKNFSINIIFYLQKKCFVKKEQIN